MRPEADPLAGLRTRGRWPLPPGRRVGIVGSRRPTPYGEAVARVLAAELAGRGVAIISGLAVGIDTAAHRGALEAGGITVAVMGTGVDVVYPRRNARLADEIVAGGGTLVSQFPDGTPPRREHFPLRNRVIAALSEVVVVVEAGATSGALITADHALSLGRDVMAVPGSVFSPLSVGCHRLLREGAGLVQNSRDVMAALGDLVEVLDDPLGLRPGGPPPALEGVDGILLHLSEVLPIEAGELTRKLDLEYRQVLARLTALELAGKVVRKGDGYLRLTPPGRRGL